MGVSDLVRGLELQVILDDKRCELADVKPSGPPGVLSGKVLLATRKKLSNLVNLSLSLEGALKCDATVLNLINEVMGNSFVQPTTETIASAEELLWSNVLGAEPAVAPSAEEASNIVSELPSKRRGRSVRDVEDLMSAQREKGLSQSSPKKIAPSPKKSSSDPIVGRVPAGTYEWPFTFRLPSSLLPSAHTRHGEVVYIVKAKLTRKGRLADIISRQPVTVARTRPRGASFNDHLIKDKHSLFSGTVTMPSVAYCEDRQFRVTLSLRTLNTSKVHRIVAVKCCLKEITRIRHGPQSYSDPVMLGEAPEWKPDDTEDDNDSMFFMTEPLDRRAHQLKVSDHRFSLSIGDANPDISTKPMNISHVVEVTVEYEGPDSTASRKPATELSSMQVPISMVSASSRRPVSWAEGLPEKEKVNHVVEKHPLRHRNGSEPLPLLTRKVNQVSSLDVTRPAGRRAARSSPARPDSGGAHKKESPTERVEEMPSPGDDTQTVPVDQIFVGGDGSDHSRWTLDADNVYTFEAAPQLARNETMNETVQGISPAVDSARMRKVSHRQSGGVFSRPPREVENLYRQSLYGSKLSSDSDSPLARSLRGSGRWEMDPDGVYTFI
ncbi:hypothetical protein BC832DRAFT_591470 [Gaertneriomyces semiglobifer]|nr:hypothetical protein BC832DRAFT_591470 [Gaertneriomyces semiglobifer]